MALIEPFFPDMLQNQNKSGHIKTDQVRCYQAFTVRVPSTTRKFKWRFFFGWDYVSTMYLLSSTVLTHLNRISTQNFNKDLDQFLIVMFIVFLIIIIFFYEFSFLYIVWKSCRIISFGSIILIGWLVMQAYMHGL